jgi:MFS family permease
MGLCVALSMPISYVFLFTHSLNIGGLENFEIVLVGLLYLLSVSAILLKPKDKEISEREARRSRGAGTRQLVLYAAPIFLFYIVLGVLLSTVFPTIQDNINADRFYMMWAIPVLFGSLFGGIQLDTRGRKFPMIVGLAITGVSLAVLGVLGIRQGFVSIITLAIGYSIVSISSFIIWSDLSPMRSRGLHYGLGFGLMGVALLIGLMVSGGSFGIISESRLRSFMFFSAVALFLCIPPLIVAEDALPKEIIEKRQMEEHLKRAMDRMRKQKS